MKTPSQPAQPSLRLDAVRALLLERVETQWIEGVLEAGLGERHPLRVPLRPGPEFVAHPWADVVRVDEEIPADTAGLPAHMAGTDGSLLLLGEPGSGKTTALLGVAEALLERAKVDAQAPVPVVLNLASFAASRGGDLSRWLEGELVTRYGLPRARVRRWLASDGIILLLDGLDEVASARREACVAAINAFRAETPLRAVVTCRTRDYAALGEQLAFEAAAVLGPIPAATFDAEATAQVPDGADADDITAELAAFHTPLMLQLLSGATTGSDPAHRDDTVDDPPVDALDRAYRGLVTRAFERAGTAPTRRRAQLRALRWLARAMRRREVTELWLEELDVAWFEHPAQRMFARALGVAMLALVTLTSMALASVATGQGLVSGLLLGAAAVVVVISFNRGLEIRPVENLQWSWRRALRNAPRSVAIGTIVGAVYGMFFIFWINVVNGAVLGLVLMLTVGLEPAERDARVAPNSGIRRSVVTATVLGLTGGLAGGVMLGFVVAPIVRPDLDPTSTAYGAAHPFLAIFAETAVLMAIIVGMIYGGLAALLHLALRVVVWASTPVPLRLVRLLEEAVALGLMRRVGGGYMFLHRTFRDFLADVGAADTKE